MRRELGGEIAIDAEGYAHLIGRESYDQIADHVRFDEDGMTALKPRSSNRTRWVNNLRNSRGSSRASTLRSKRR